MPGVDDGASQSRPALDLLADEEERRGGAVLGKHLEDGWCRLSVRTVVERESDRRRCDMALDAESACKPLQMRRGRRNEPVESHAASERTSEAADGRSAIE
jgi:hypothetical protein